MYKEAHTIGESTNLLTACLSNIYIYEIDINKSKKRIFEEPVSKWKITSFFPKKYKQTNKQTLGK